MQVPFSKYSGCGNDFILIDNRNTLISAFPTPWIQKVCHRKFGIGADGIIFLENSPIADFKMRIFNLDGSEASMCGNGIRCFLQFASVISHSLPPTVTVETACGILSGTFKNGHPSIKMPLPTDFRWNLTLDNNPSVKLHHINTGVPHVVIFVEDLETIETQVEGRKLRYHPTFNPQGVNVNWVKILNDNTLIYRTYERGVEDETLACGTGATAAAIAANKFYQLSQPITAITRSDEKITIDFSHEGSEIKNLSMTGPVHFIYNGTIAI